MKKGIILIALAALFALPVKAQNNFNLNIDEFLGIGFGAGPTLFSSTAVTAEYTIADLVVVGGGVGLRYGLMTDKFDLDTKKRTRSNFEVDLPIFARAGVKYSIVSAKVDVGYSIGLFAFGLGSVIPGSGPVAKRYAGFFLEPHIDLALGTHRAVGVGILLQSGSYEQSQTVTAADGSTSTNLQEVKKMIPALTLRYVRTL